MTGALTSSKSTETSPLALEASLWTRRSPDRTNQQKCILTRQRVRRNCQKRARINEHDNLDGTNVSNHYQRFLVFSIKAQFCCSAHTRNKKIVERYWIPFYFFSLFSVDNNTSNLITSKEKRRKEKKIDLIQGYKVESYYFKIKVFSEQQDDMSPHYWSRCYIRCNTHLMILKMTTRKRGNETKRKETVVWNFGGERWQVYMRAGYDRVNNLLYNLLITMHRNRN